MLLQSEVIIWDIIKNKISGYIWDFVTMVSFMILKKSDFQLNQAS